MLNTITENRLKNNVKAFLDYVTYQKQPVLIARDDGNVVMIPQEMYEAVEEYMQMREAQELAGPRALPESTMMMPPTDEPMKAAKVTEQPSVAPKVESEEKDEPSASKFEKPEGLNDAQIDWSLFPEAAEALQQEKDDEPKQQESTYTFSPKQDKKETVKSKADAKTKASQYKEPQYDKEDENDEEDDPEFAELKRQIAERVAASLKSKGIYLNDDAFNKLVDEAINEIARGNMSFLQQLDDLPNADGYRG